MNNKSIENNEKEVYPKSAEVFRPVRLKNYAANANLGSIPMSMSRLSLFIPALGIIVSLIGTFAFMAVAGFSINMLTLFALVLVIGTVVDDSIVVVEAVQTRISLTPALCAMILKPRKE